MLSDYKKLLKLEIEINAELVELVHECFDEIFGKDSITAKNDLNDTLDNYEGFGCISDLECYKHNVCNAKERHAKWLADQEARKNGDR